MCAVNISYESVGALTGACLNRHGLQVGTPRTHRKFLNRDDGSYGPIPARRPLGMLGMPFNRTSIKVCGAVQHFFVLFALDAACVNA